MQECDAQECGYNAGIGFASGGEEKLETRVIGDNAGINPASCGEGMLVTSVITSARRWHRLRELRPGKAGDQRQ